MLLSTYSIRSTLAWFSNDDIGGANTTDFYFAGVITKATLTVDANPVVRNGKLTF